MAATGASVWRSVLEPTDFEGKNLAAGDDITSFVKISRAPQMFKLEAGQQWLFQLDGLFDNIGSTGLHSHHGSGIRCLTDGNIHIRSNIGESFDLDGKGACWYEEGSYPVCATIDDDTSAAFIRAMLLPVEYEKLRYNVNWMEGQDPPEAKWKFYARSVITLQ